MTSNLDFETLPDRFYQGGDMHLAMLPNVKVLPEHLFVNGNLYISGSSLTSLPFGLQVSGSVIAYECHALQHIGEGISIGSNLEFSGCKFKSLPDDLDIGGNLYLARCMVDHLPSMSLYSLNIIQCNSLVQIPRMFLRNHLNVANCSSIQSISDDFTAVLARIQNCPSLISSIGRILPGTKVVTEKGIVTALIDGEIWYWCRDNGIQHVQTHTTIGPFSAVVDVIENDAQRMYYMMRWG